MTIFNFSIFIHLLANPLILRGLKDTVLLTVTVWLASVIIGFPLALMLQAKRWPVRGLASAYVWFFRAIPPLLLIIFVYDGLPLVFPALKGYFSSPYDCGFLALTLIDTAFVGEIFRGSLIGVEEGQRDASRALGLTYGKTQIHVVAGQAVRIAIPGLGNMFIGTTKNTSLVSVISYFELTFAAQDIYSVNFRILEALSAAAFYYLILASLFTLLQRLVEYRLDVTRRKVSANTHASFGSRVVQRASTTLAGFSSRRRPITGGPVLNGGSPTGAPVNVRQLHKSFGSQEILKDVDLEVASGEVVVMMGPSGSGKSTLLRCLNQLERIDVGTITVGDHRIVVGESGRGAYERHAAAHRAEVGMVFQRFNLFPNRTALGNVALAPRVVRKIPREQAAAIATDLLTKVGLADRMHHYPYQLSGGQQQRVAIARALAMSPRVLLFDEPTSALDPELIGDVVELVRQLREEGYTLLVVSHEMRFVRRVADRVLMLENGRIIESGTPTEIFEAPKEERTRQFVRMLA